MQLTKQSINLNKPQLLCSRSLRSHGERDSPRSSQDTSELSPLPSISSVTNRSSPPAKQHALGFLIMIPPVPPFPALILYPPSQNQPAVKNCLHTHHLPASCSFLAPLRLGVCPQYSLDQGIQVTNHLHVSNDNKHFCPPLINLLPAIHSLFSTLPSAPGVLPGPSNCGLPPTALATLPQRGTQGSPVCLLLYAITLGHLIHTHSLKPHLEANASQMYILTMTTKLLHKYWLLCARNCSKNSFMAANNPD